MNRKALALTGALGALCATTALAATTDVGIRTRQLNGVKKAVKKDGSLRAEAVGHLQLKNRIVSCQKLEEGLAKKLCKGSVAIPGSPGTNGDDGAIGTPGKDGVGGATGEQGSRGDGTIIVNPNTPGVCYTNASVNLTPLGVTFGPYTSNEQGGSVCVDPGEGVLLRDIARLSYTASFNATTDNGDAPYLRLFIDNDEDGKDDHVVIYSPSTQPGACYGPLPIPGPGSQCATRGRMITYEVTEGTVRYDDDPGALPDQPWAVVANTHGTDKVSAIYITSGFSLPDTTGAVLNSIHYEIAGHLPITLAFAS